MEPSRLEQQIKFILEIDKLKTVLRQTWLVDGSRRENDAEHSWHLALMVMILAEHFPGLDILKTLKMVLVHDLVEIDAGDTYAYDREANKDKDAREHAAAQRLFSLLPGDQQAEIDALWREFEALRTREAICGAVIDRLQPFLLNISADGRIWREHGVTSAHVIWRNQITLDQGPKVIADYILAQIKEAESRHFFAAD
jgi:putative hydrolases of HD superfamily